MGKLKLRQERKLAEKDVSLSSMIKPEDYDTLKDPYE